MLGRIALAALMVTALIPPMPPQEPVKAPPMPECQVYEGPVLTRENGTIQGPSGKETYYNLPMDGVVAIMREAGFDEEAYPYWVRDDGCKMLGGYIMVAADQDLRPLGTIVPTSRGLGIVWDTGTFIYDNREQLDLAVNW